MLILKINFLAWDSILAAPIILDLALFMGLAQRVRMGGIQGWLSFSFKSPMTLPELYPEHYSSAPEVRNSVGDSERVVDVKGANSSTPKLNK